MPDTATLTSVDDLLEVVADWNDGGLTAAYVRLLHRATTEAYPVGVLESTVQAEALSDWEAAMCLSKDVAVDDITQARETLCRTSPLIVRDGSRKGRPTFRLHDDLI